MLSARVRSHAISLLVAHALAIGLVSGVPAQTDADVGDLSAYEVARERARDAETLRSLSAEGQLLYERDRVKLTGFQYCSQSVALAERGDFRASIRAAAKALHLGQTASDDALQAAAKRDLAIAFSYAGDLARAEEHARAALEHRASESAVIAGPVHKIIGDVRARQRQWAQAIESYRFAVGVSSDRFRPLVEISLANALVSSGDVARARELYERIAPPENAALRQMFRRGLGQLRLVEGRPIEALALFDKAVQEASGPDAAYHRLWALDGMGRAHLAAGDRPLARRALEAWR